MSVSDSDFKLALGAWASGVSVVTASAEGEVFGMTVSSFASVSLRSKLISVCLAEHTRTLRLILASECFAVNLLSKVQREVSARFASSQPGVERLEQDTYVLGPMACPLLHGALVHLECRLQAVHQASDHQLLIGEVRFAQTATGAPLLYHARNYGEFTPLSS